MRKFSAIPQKTICYLGLGSNLGNREQFIADALEILKKNSEITIIKISSIIETEPYGKINQPQFLNCAVENGDIAFLIMILKVFRHFMWN